MELPDVADSAEAADEGTALTTEAETVPETAADGAGAVRRDRLPRVGAAVLWEGVTCLASVTSAGAAVAS